MLEAGFCRAKNTVSILSKNLIVFGITTVVFWAIGFGLMFGFGGHWQNSAAIDNGFVGLHGFFLSGMDNSPATGNVYQGVYRSLSWAGVPIQAKFFFQLMFAGAAATIVSGAVAERIKFLAFCLFSCFLVGLIYPIVGHWVWGGGWLSHLGFWDFAGSSVVHSVGGWAAFVGVVMLGPRLGKYRDGKSFGLPGHNLALSTLGGLILWFAWFGFNSGSLMAANPAAIGQVLLTTNMAGATGAIAATLTAWKHFKKPDLSVMINGVLAGLVSITASCRYVNIESAALIGVIAGIMIVFLIDTFDNLQIDDPIGAISVHLVCGIWGTLAVGLFAIGPNTMASPNFVPYTDGPSTGLLIGGGLEGLRQLSIQVLGITSIGLFSIFMSGIAWATIRSTVGIRVSQQAELKGLDLSEFGMKAYSDFSLKQDSSQDKY